MSATNRMKVGTKVRFQVGARRYVGMIVEDLGLIGVNGRQIVRIEVQLDPTYVREFEVPTELLTQVSAPAKPTRV
jgi:hypothetical protein